MVALEAVVWLVQQGAPQWRGQESSSFSVDVSAGLVSVGCPEVVDSNPSEGMPQQQERNLPVRVSTCRQKAQASLCPFMWAASGCGPDFGWAFQPQMIQIWDASSQIK